MEDRRTLAPVRPLPIPSLRTPVSQPDEALRRALGKPLPATPQGNLLARALDELASTNGLLANTPAGHLTYTADNGDTITIALDTWTERQIARAVHNAAAEARSLAALSAIDAARTDADTATVTSIGRRPLRLAPLPGGVA